MRRQPLYQATANTTFESLDFEEVENDVIQEFRQEKNGKLDPPKWQMWLIIIISGMVTGIVAFCIDKGIQGLNTVKFNIVTHYMHTPGSQYNITNTTHIGEGDLKIDFWTPYLLFVVVNLAYVSVAAFLVITIEPIAKGSGIGEIKCYLNGIKMSRVVRLKTLICKATGILFSVASGLPVGKEGPMIHSGAAIASGISTGKSSKMHWDTGLFKEFRGDHLKRKFVTAGAAAGVGAAFGAPVGGVLFAVEEVGSFWNIELTVMVFVCATMAPWMLSILQHPDQYETGLVNGLIDFGKVTGDYHYYDIPFLILLGICGGLFGASFIYTNIQMAKLRKRYVTTKLRRYIEVWVVSFLVSTVLFVLVARGYRCEDVDTISKEAVVRGSLKSFGCPHGQYNDMATYFFQTMEKSISLLIHSENNVHYTTLLKQFIPYYFLTILTYGIYVPSGLFLPNLALGCNFGHLFAQGWNSVIPGHRLSPSQFALFGGTAVLAGCVRMTISVIMIVMEATGNSTFFYPLVILTLSATYVGNRFTHGIYDAHLHLNKIPLLESNMDNADMHLLQASDVMNPKVIRIRPDSTVGELINVLKANPYQHALIVVDPATGIMKGLILRRAVLILLDKRAWERELRYIDFQKSAREREFLKLKKYHFFDKILPEEYNQRIDLMRYADKWPHHVFDTHPVPRIYRCFRELGLRHMVVLDESRRPVGLITRKQLCFLKEVDPAVVSSMEHAHLLGSGVAIDEEGLPSPASLDTFREDTEWQDAYRKHIN